MNEIPVSKVDLHTHARTVDEAMQVVAQAEKAGVQHLAILRKGGNTFSLKEMQQVPSENLDIHFGTEYTCRLGAAGYIDLIAMDFDPSSESMTEWTQAIRGWNLSALMNQVSILRGNFEIDHKFVKKLSLGIENGDVSERAFALAQVIASNPENVQKAKAANSLAWDEKREFYQRELPDDLRDAKLIWLFYLSPGSPEFIAASPSGLGAQQFVDAVHGSGERKMGSWYWCR